MDRGKKGWFFHSPAFSLKNRLALTTGAPSGIGKIAATGALKILGPKKNFQFLLWTGAKEKSFKIPGFQTLVFKTAEGALKSPFNENQILQITNPKGAGGQLEEAAKICLSHKASALITGPVSKQSIKNHRPGTIGQTALLKILSRKKQVFMCFRGALFNVILWTDHIPLKAVFINPKDFKNFLKFSLQARVVLPEKLQKKPLGLLGLNPHAGEGGLIGKEEREILQPVLKSFSSTDIQGPLVPDAAFLKKNWRLYSFFIALYHDQGLIPFKMAHSHKGFVQTLGLPFLRLGVDHGTGENLKIQEVSCQSFLNSIREAIRLIRSA